MAYAADSSSGERAGSAGGRQAAEPPAAPRPQAGVRVLMVLATPLNLRVLTALAERPMRLAELRRAAGLPAQTTLRGHLASLAEIGVLRKRPTAQMPYAVEHELTPLGRGLLEVAERLERWLGEAPGGAVSLWSGAAKGTVKAFADGWGSAMMRGLGARPMTLTELDRRILDLSYQALERRLSSMRMAGLVEARESDGVGTPYALTTWARRGAGPLGAAIGCERTHLGVRAAPLTSTDIEAAFLLAMPLVGLPEQASGRCQLEVEPDPAALDAQAGVLVTVERGRVVACDSELGPSPGDYAVGSAARWCGAIGQGTAGLLRIGGDRRVAEGLVSGLHAALASR